MIKTTAELCKHLIDTTAPFPQDTPIGKIPAIVALINAGDCTDGDLAYSLGVSEQQGNYAGIALRYLGLASRDSNMSPAVLSLTESGEELLTLTVEEQHATLVGLVAQMDIENLDSKGYSDTTREYRDRTLKTWKSALKDLQQWGLEAHDDMVEALEKSTNATRPARAIPVPRFPEPKPLTMCSSCFVVIPLTGKCDQCD